MSAVAGILHRDGRPADAADVTRMVDVLAHRGPDGAAVWHEGPVGLGHRMLHTTPESLHETLPLVRREARLAITSDARLDNREELIRAFGLQDRPAGEIPDSELILAAYEKWGEACPEHLLGDFAFAVWDSRRQQLFCARSPFGLRAFFYTATDQLFAFATEIKGLLCLEAVPRRLDETRVVDYLLSEFDDLEITFYRDVRRLPPAHALTVSHSGFRLRCYWRLDPSREVRLRSDREYAEALGALFSDAVRCRTRSAFPVGSMLSGGLDSSAVACVAHDLIASEGHGTLHTFSAVFPTLAECDETRFMQAVLSQRVMESHPIQAEKLSPLEDLSRVLWHADEAVFAFTGNIPWAVYRAASEQSVRVVLDGFDGDTTISHGDAALREYALSGRWLMLLQESLRYSHLRREPVFTELARVVRDCGGETLTGLLARKSGHSGGCQLNSPLPPLNSDFITGFAVGERLEKFVVPRAVRPATQRLEHFARLSRGVHVYLAEFNDRSAAAFGVEPRSPFWDRRLVEFCLALPPEQKMQGGWDRIILRRAMQGILPPEVQWRRGKIDFKPFFLRNLLAMERARLDAIVLNGSGCLAKLFDVPRLKECYRNLLVEPMNATERDIVSVWKAVSLALWLEHAGLGI